MVNTRSGKSSESSTIQANIEQAAQRHSTTKLPTRNDYHLSRKLWHIIGGSIIAYIYVVWDVDRWIAAILLGLLFAAFTGVEVGRQRSKAFREMIMSVWKPLLRQHELTQLSGTFWYILGVFLSVLLFPQAIAVLAILYLSVGDPLASIFGIMLREAKPYRLASGKSLLGTVAASLICGLLTHALLKNNLPILITEHQLLQIAIVGGVAGGLSELTSPAPINVDDNFLIPIFSGAALYAITIVLGVDPSLLRIK